MSAAAKLWFKVGSFLLVGMLWGCSNAVLKQTTATGADAAAPQSSSSSKQKQASGNGAGLWRGLMALLGTKVRDRSRSNQMLW